MSNKTQLQTNNTTLDGYIGRINAAKEVAAGLPEAGSGGSGNIETCTVTITGINDGRLRAIGTLVNSDNSLTLSSESIENYSSGSVQRIFLKNAGLVLISDDWSYNLPGTTCTGAVIESWHCQGGAMLIRFEEDTALLEIVRV